MKQYIALTLIGLVLAMFAAAFLPSIVNRAIANVSARLNPQCMDLIHAEPSDSARDIGTICRGTK
jgi:hypothetical protein